MPKPTKGTPDYSDIGVGENLKILRLAHKVCQQEIGAYLGVSFQQIQKYEKGINRISACRLFRITQFLKVSISDLFRGLDL